MSGATGRILRAFLSTLSLRRATIATIDCIIDIIKFLSTLSLRRATVFGFAWLASHLNFYPRSPCGERPSSVKQSLSGSTISIHALLAESDNNGHETTPNKVVYFYPRSPCGERRLPTALRTPHHKFLSTLSLRRATTLILTDTMLHAEFLSTLSLRRATREKPRQTRTDTNFYPRSPCGERQSLGLLGWLRTLISIHALLAESDPAQKRYHGSAPTDFYPRSPCGERPANRTDPSAILDFYPRSPCGERPGTTSAKKRRWISIHALLAESDPHIRNTSHGRPCISIHALLAESDERLNNPVKVKVIFLSTLSLRRATEVGIPNTNTSKFLSTLSLRRATCIPRSDGLWQEISIHALLAESDNWPRVMVSPTLISIHALLAESDSLSIV